MSEERNICEWAELHEKRQKQREKSFWEGLKAQGISKKKYRHIQGNKRIGEYL